MCSQMCDELIFPDNSFTAFLALVRSSWFVLRFLLLTIICTTRKESNDCREILANVLELNMRCNQPNNSFTHDRSKLEG